MSKSSTYLLRLDPQKKALWEEKAGEAGISLAKWIESRCDRSGDGFQENLSRGVPGVLAGDGRPNEKVYLEKPVPMPEGFTGRPYSEQPTSVSPQTDTNPVTWPSPGVYGPPVIGGPNEFQDTPPMRPRPYPKGLEPKPFERKPVGKIAKMLKEKG